MSNPADDFPEDDTSARLSTLYRQLPADEPSAATDDAILAAARRATKSGPAAVPWTRRWRVPLAAAATLLLAFGILLQMPTQRMVVQEALEEQQALDEQVTMNAEPTVAAAPPSAAPEEIAEVAEAAPPQRAPESLAKEKREFSAAPAPAKKSAVAAQSSAQPGLQSTAQLADADADDAEATGSGSGSAAGAIAATAETRAEMEADTADALVAAQQPQAEPARERIVAEAKAEAEMTAASSAKSLRNAPTAPVAAAAPPPTPVAPAVLQPRGAPWPFGLVPTLAPDTACARLTQESGGECRARIVSGGLELRLTGGDNQWLYRLRDSLAELGWQEASGVAAGSGHYSRRTTAGVERFEWSPQSGALVLKLLAAD